MNSATPATSASVNGRAMTIGQLSRRTGVPVKRYAATRVWV